MSERRQEAMILEGTGRRPVALASWTRGLRVLVGERKGLFRLGSERGARASAAVLCVLVAGWIVPPAVDADSVGGFLPFETVSPPFGGAFPAPSVLVLTSPLGVDAQGTATVVWETLGGLRSPAAFDFRPFAATVSAAR